MKKSITCKACGSVDNFDDVTVDRIEYIETEKEPEDVLTAIT